MMTGLGHFQQLAYFNGRNLTFEFNLALNYHVKLLASNM
ncbi:hypothetical protein LPL9_0684 [Lacticaseibacillus paracasei]|nr:hypothetical protein LPL9_0684 [Lacticaseibacillus paracasei]OUC69279.1 hypothetical protein BLL69_0879 [Lacticaseibacillus paracasei]